MSRRLRTLFALSAAALSLAAVARQEPARAEPTRQVQTTLDRVYTDEQAARGKVLFGDICIVCHTDPFWREGWEGRSLADLYVLINRFMPDDNPGSLTGKEVAEVLAYILKTNDLPAGQSVLPADELLLRSVLIVPGAR